MAVAKQSNTLLRWYDQYGRDLPWRHTHDPYAILVSEIMLQQTQVDRVLFFYDRWLNTFPTWEALATASTSDVLHAWAGLGYNRRALVLHGIAQHIVANGVPTTEQEWKLLKGIGNYTAAAICSFALNQRTLPIDTNIRRVIGRWLLGIPFAQLDDDPAILEALNRIVPKQGRYSDFIQALFDLATAVCQKTPACAQCPLKTSCQSAQAFLAGTIAVPKQMVKKARESKHRNKPFPDRIYRGRILKLVRDHSPQKITAIGSHIDPQFDPKLDTDWLHAMITRMEKDGLIVQKNGSIRLT